MTKKIKLTKNQTEALNFLSNLALKEKSVIVNFIAAGKGAVFKALERKGYVKILIEWPMAGNTSTKLRLEIL